MVNGYKVGLILANWLKLRLFEANSPKLYKELYIIVVWRHKLEAWSIRYNYTKNVPYNKYILHEW